MNAACSSYAFDVASVLGIGEPYRFRIPSRPGSMTLRVPAGISPLSLRGSSVGRDSIWQEVTWYDPYPWARATLVPGLYDIRLPIPGSAQKTFGEQHSLLFPGEIPAPLALVEVALLCCKKLDLPDPLDGGWIRCAETVGDGQRVAFAWGIGRLGLFGCWDDGAYESVWFAGTELPPP